MRLRIVLDVDIEDGAPPGDTVQHLIDYLNATNPNVFPEITGVNDGYWQWQP